MTSKTWRVWSYDAANDGWVAIDVGTPAEMQAGADRRNSTSRRNDLPGSYVALPADGTPDADLAKRAREVHLRLYLGPEHAHTARCGSSLGSVTGYPDAVTCKGCHNAVIDAREQTAAVPEEDDLDKYVREESARDPAFAAAYKSAGAHAARRLRLREVLAGALGCDYRTIRSAMHEAVQPWCVRHEGPAPCGYVEEVAEAIEPLLEPLAAVARVCDQAEAGEFATAGRDFGRGAAEVARRVRAALAASDNPTRNHP